jgi:hypothetical protein
MSLLLRVAVHVAIAIQLAGCSPALNWRELRPEGSGIVALFPCSPDRHARTVRLAGAPVHMEMLVCDAAGVTFAVSFVDLPDAAAVGPALGQLRAAAQVNLGADTASAVPAQVNGMSGHPNAVRASVRGKLPDGREVQQQALFFAKGLRVYQASVIGARVSAEVADTFFGALVLPA